MSAETTIVCDVCGRAVTTAGTKTEARAELIARGGAALHDRDYCHDCLRLRADRSGLVERDLEAHLFRATGLSKPGSREVALSSIALAKARQRALLAEWGARDATAADLEAAARRRSAGVSTAAVTYPP